MVQCHFRAEQNLEQIQHLGSQGVFMGALLCEDKD